MARVNVGVNPLYISDQHLIAESLEITMITGALKKQNFNIKTEIPNTMNLGIGYLTFFKNKIVYLKNRLDEVNLELTKRNIKNSTHINLSEYPKHLLNDWKPSINDSIILRERIVDRLFNPLLAKPGFHKYRKMSITNMEKFTKKLKESKLFYV